MFCFHIENARVFALFFFVYWVGAKIDFEIENRLAETDGGGYFFCGICADFFSRPNNYI